MEESNNFYDQLVEKYLTKRNIIIVIILIVLFTFGSLIYNYLVNPKLTLKPNQTEYHLQLIRSPEAFTREKAPDILETTLLDQKNTNEFSLKIKPNYYYKILISKENYTTWQYSFYAESFNSYIFEPELIQPLIGDNIQFPAIKDNELIYLDSNNLLTGLNLDTRETSSIENNSWYGVKNIIYSPDKNKAILKVKYDLIAFSGGYNRLEDEEATTSVFFQPDLIDGKNYIWTFNMENKEYHLLDQNIKDIKWLNNDKIIYEYSNMTGESFGDPDFEHINNINVANYDGSNWQSIYSLANSNLTFSKIIPNPADENQVLLLPQPFESGNEVKTTINLLNINSNTIAALTEEGIYDAGFSPDGSKIVYAKLDAEKSFAPTLWLVNIDGTNNISLDTNTLVAKTAWIDNNNLAAAVPTIVDMPDNYDEYAIPPNYYTQPDFETSDILYTINISNQNRQNLIENNFQYLVNIHNIVTNGNNIYFQDSSNKLYTLPLNNN